MLLFAYAIIFSFVCTRKGAHWPFILKIACLFGLATGLFEILAISAENGVPSFLQTKWFQLAEITGVFCAWGFAGFYASRELTSLRAGLLTAILASMICMLTAVTGGLIIELYLIPADPAVVATWQEFKRSGWTDPTAFRIANTFDSASSHLLLAPIVAAIFGTIGSALGSRGTFYPSR